MSELAAWEAELTSAFDGMASLSGERPETQFVAARAALAGLLAEIKQLTAKVESLEASAVALASSGGDLEAKLGAATTMLAEAERIVPGVITTAGRLALGLNDRERAIAAEAGIKQRDEALAEIVRLHTADKEGICPAADIARAALAGVGCTDTEPQDAADDLRALRGIAPGGDEC